jgi:hypothetical protein
MGLHLQAVAAVAPFLMADLELGYGEIGTLIGIFLLPGAFLALAGVLVDLTGSTAAPIWFCGLIFATVVPLILWFRWLQQPIISAEPSIHGQFIAEPSTAEPSTAEPSIAEPSTAEPSIAEPSTEGGTEQWRSR